MKLSIVVPAYNEEQRIERMRSLSQNSYPLEQARIDLLLKQNLT